VCRHVPAHPPRNFREALQTYWFLHLGTITELNGWDAMNPGHLDRHLYPFYRKGLEDGTLTEDAARELLGCFTVKMSEIVPVFSRRILGPGSIKLRFDSRSRLRSASTIRLRSFPSWDRVKQ